MKKIVILGDSLSMPRPDDKILFEDTYPYLLSLNTKNIVINRSRRKNDTNEQTKNQNIFDDIIYLKPDYLIIHLGIVDCAPRLFTRKGLKRLSYLKKIKQHVIKIASRNRYSLTKIFKKVYVEPEKFEKNFSTLVKIAKRFTNNIYIINIANTNKDNIQKSYGFTKNINAYNKILHDISIKENITFIDINFSKENILIDDGIHLNKNGNVALSKMLTNYINND